MMWAHYENGVNYLDARICIASCDTPEGDLLSPFFLLHRLGTQSGQMVCG